VKLLVLDFEGSGLNTTPHAVERFEAYENEPHRPGQDPDCILEVGLVVLDAETLKEEQRFSAAVLPPGADNNEKLGRWTAMLREKNSFVYEMHEKSGLLNNLKNPGVQEVLYVSEVEARLCALVMVVSDRAKVDGAGPMHPGNSDVMFTGNSIANYDIPLMKLWMPKLHKLLAYRIMDVSVLRTFYTDLARVALPPGLADKIKTGGGGHRALSDAEWCADALRECVTYARNASAASGVVTLGGAP
jgi:oligoribonuclease (3'-5' exoribonuclease)